MQECVGRRGKVDFLEHTCEKAGLEKNFWKRNDVNISKFEGIIFKEENPNGKIVREVLWNGLCLSV